MRLITSGTSCGMGNWFLRQTIGKSFIQRDFREQIKDSINKPVFKQWDHLFQKNGLSQLTKYQYLDIKTFLADNNLSRVDRMSMANSLEVRLPFLDINVVEAAFKLNPHDRIRRFNTKVALRKIMKGRLPAKVLRMNQKGVCSAIKFLVSRSLKEICQGNPNLRTNKGHRNYLSGDSLPNRKQTIYPGGRI